MARFLHDGLLAGSAHRPVDVRYDTAGVQRLFGAAQAPAKLGLANLEVRFVADAKVDDGRFANNGWLQECPEPITKISWDNAILISPKLGKELGIDPKGALLQVARKEEAEFSIGKENAPIAELTIGTRKVRGPVHIQPGLSNYTVVLPLGYGRSATGHVGRDAGFNAYPLRTAAAQHFATGGKLTLTGERMLLANTQEHWSMEGRDIVREANLDEVQKEGGAGLAYVKGIGMESHTPAVLGEEGARRVGELGEPRLVHDPGRRPQPEVPSVQESVHAVDAPQGASPLGLDAHRLGHLKVRAERGRVPVREGNRVHIDLRSRSRNHDRPVLPVIDGS